MKYIHKFAARDYYGCVSNSILLMQLDLFIERNNNYTKPAMILDNEFDKNLKFIYQDRDKIQ